MTTIKEITLKDGSKRYRFVVDVGREAGKRKQVTRTFDTYAEAEADLSRQLATTHRTVSLRYRRAIADVLAEDLRTFILPTNRPDGMTYVVLAGPYVKIGFSVDPDRRLTELRSRRRLRVPDDLDRSKARISNVFSGGKEAEDALHWLARNYHVVGEWYWAEPPLMEALEQLAAVDGTEAAA